MEKLSIIFGVTHIPFDSIEDYDIISTPVFSGFFKGKTHTEETKKLMSKKAIGRKCSKETRIKMSNAQLGNKKRLGKRHSEETKKLMSEKRIGIKKSEEHKRKLSEAKIGFKYKNPRSEESRKKMSESTKLIPIILCPYCAKSGKPHVMKRWHFDNCKGK